MTALRHIWSPQVAQQIAAAPDRPKISLVQNSEPISRSRTSREPANAGSRQARRGAKLTRGKGGPSTDDKRNAISAAAAGVTKELTKRQAEEMATALAKFGGKFASKANAVTTLAFGAWSVADAWKSEGGFGPKTRKAIAGAFGGAAGAAIGGALGGPLGAALGSLVGSYLGPKAYEFAEQLGKEYVEFGKDVAKAVSKAAKAGVDAIRGVGEKLGEVVDDLGGFLSDAWDAITDFGGDIIHSLNPFD